MRTVATLFLVLVLSIGFTSSAAMAAEPPTTTSAPAEAIKEFVAKADAVVVAKIGPTAATIGGHKMLRDVPEETLARTVQITQTLKGIDFQGQQLIICRNAKGPMAADQKYILALKVGMTPALAQAAPSMEATRENIDAVTKEVAAQGGKVSPMRILWMQNSGGWGRGLIREFTLDSEGNFVWTEYAKGRVLTGAFVGKLPAEELKTLMAAVRGAGKGPQAEDAGHAEFYFTDEKGKLQSKDYSLPCQAPCADLLSSISDLAQKYGKKPQAARVPATAPAP